MKAKSTSLLVLIITLLLSHNSAHSKIQDDAPAELKAFIENDLDSIHFKSMKTHAAPLKILLTSLILEGRALGWIAKDSYDYREVFKHAGLTYPEKVIFNSKAYSWKSNDLPLGLVKKEMDFGINANINIVNLSCSACHSGAQYDSNGVRLNNSTIGAPSESFNPEVYVSLIYKGMKRVNQDWKLATKVMDHLFPETSLREKILFQTFIRLQIKSYMKSHAKIDRATPFNNGGPGLTNGIASFKNVLGLDTNDGTADGFTSIPTLADRAFRSSLLYDGIYSPINKDAFTEISSPDQTNLNDVSTIVALFTVPTMGQTPERAQKNIPKVLKLISPLLKVYKTPEFPGTIDHEKALRGEIIFKSSCTHCHGDYQWESGKKAKLTSFPNKLVHQDEMKTDPNRWKAVTDALVEKVQQTSWSKIISVNQNQGYVAPILEGLWASAPYLHNGSVPSLWHLLRPSKRPKTFYTGNQNLDYRIVGLANNNSAYTEVYDTSVSGRNNNGHEAQFDHLSEEEKDNLLEYMKLL